jgi:hypothetical protein
MAASGVRASGPFPALELADPDGAPRPLAEAWRDGQALVLIGHRDCPTTRLALPFFERIHRRRTRGTALLVLQDDAATVRTLRAELELTVPTRLEPPPYALAAQLHVRAVPTLLLIDTKGRIRRVCEGFDRRALESLAGELGVAGALFAPDDRAPAFRPG